jgi:hypothetical protein
LTTVLNRRVQADEQRGHRAAALLGGDDGVFFGRPHRESHVDDVVQPEVEPFGALLGHPSVVEVLVAGEHAATKILVQPESGPRVVVLTYETLVHEAFDLASPYAGEDGGQDVGVERLEQRGGPQQVTLVDRQVAHDAHDKLGKRLAELLGRHRAAVRVGAVEEVDRQVQVER